MERPRWRLWGAWLVLALLALIPSFVASAAHPAAAAEATPERVAAAVAQLDALSARTLERTRVPGMAIAVVYRDEVVYLYQPTGENAYGLSGVTFLVGAG